MDDFGALNSALSDPEPTLAEAVSGVALEPTLETAGDAPDAPTSAAAGEDLPAPSAEDPAAVAAETAAEATAEPTAEAPATSGPSQVA